MKIGKIELGIIPVVVGTISEEPRLSRGVAELVDVFEIRVDMLSDHTPLRVKEMIDRIKTVYGKPVIATIRTKRDGGAKELSDDERYEIFKDVIPHVEAIDIEIDAASLLEKVPADCRARGGLLIVSYHNFANTPEYGELERILGKGRELGADIVKIAVTARDERDVADLISFTIKNRDKEVVTISMGSIGAVSRIINPILGSRLTYGYIGKSAAPGQISAREIIEDLRRYAPSYNENLITTKQLRGLS